ncbi:MAG: trigger factor [Terrimicrobiaceae bacterium]|nr:trigger factor [Terrimicrobiaceae bacterium]
MNVVVESQPNCIATLRVELEPERVEREWQTVARQFQKMARLPGYRPGKAPQALVDRKFSADIREELTNKLLRQAMNEAIEEKKIRVITVSKVEGIEIAPDKSMRFTATVVTSPDFELPDYSKIELEVAKRAVTDAEVDEALQGIAEQHADFQSVEGRALEMGDFAVLTYAGTTGGRPLAEAVENCPPLLAGKPNWWIRLAPETLAPGFCEALVGLSIGESREFTLDIPADFPFAAVRGKQLAYAVTLHEIRTRELPPLDDALANKLDVGKTMAEVRDRLRTELEKRAENEFETAKRSGAIQYLLSQVTCELPVHLINNEMSGILREIVQENQGRGVSDEELKSHEDEILGAAKQSATERVRTTFLLMRVAEKENLKVTEQDLAFHVTQLAARYQVPVQKFVKDLQKRDAFGQIREQILVGKALDFITSNVTVREPSAQPAQTA